MHAFTVFFDHSSYVYDLFIIILSTMRIIQFSHVVESTFWTMLMLFGSLFYLFFIWFSFNIRKKPVCIVWIWNLETQWSKINVVCLWFEIVNSPGQTVPMPAVSSGVHLQALPGDTHTNAHGRAALSMWPLSEAICPEVDTQHPQANSHRYA